MTKTLVTGACGFIGLELCRELQENGHHVVGNDLHEREGPWEAFQVGDVSRPLPPAMFNGVELVIHLAGKAHALAELGQDEDEYRRVNALGTQHVLEGARDAGVKRVVLFSSIKAMGEGNAGTGTAQPIDEAFPCNPTTPYGISKREAEDLVLHGGYVPEGVVLRLCMVYGDKAKGNMAEMVQAIARRRFPPLPEFGNKRSIVHIRDVIQATLLAATHAKASGQAFIVSDGVDYTTKEMCDMIREALGRRHPRVAVPVAILTAMAVAGDMIGRVRGRRFVFDSDRYDKIRHSSLYSSEKIRTMLGFHPTMTLPKALPDMLASLGISAS